MKRTDRAIKRYHKDDVSKITGLVLGVIAGGLAAAIGKVVQWARKARADKEREREYIEYIRTGKITESKYVSEIIYVIKRAIDRYYLSGDLDPIFNRNGIVPSRRDAYIKKIKEDISKCKTLDQLNNYIETKTPFHSSHFDDLEYVTELFRKARTMRDSKSFKVITHDSMPWTNTNATRKRRNLDAAIKRYIDRAEKAKKVQNELKKKIKKVDQDINRIEKTAEKVNDKTTSKTVQNIKKYLKKFAVTIGQILLVGGVYGLLIGITAVILMAMDRLENYLDRRMNERGAQERFNQWRAANGRPPAGNNTPANNPPRTPTNGGTPSNGGGTRNNSYFAEQLRNLRAARRDVEDIRRTVQEARSARENTNTGVRGLDLGDVPFSQTTSPGEHGARFSGLDLDSKFGKKQRGIITHDLMPWVKKKTRALKE